MVRQLLEAGADPSVTASGQTAVDMARSFEQTDIVNLLTESSSPQQQHGPDKYDDTNNITT